MKSNYLEIPGKLVALPSRGAKRPLDGFWTPGKRSSRTLLVYVHGMHSNFYRSALKKTFMKQAGGLFDVLSFNNRGAEQGTNDERFQDCLKDIDAALEFGHDHGYRRFLLAGHSTGCQKVTYYQALRRDRCVVGLMLLAIGDDYAIMKRDLGPRFAATVRKARRMARQDQAHAPLHAEGIAPFSARRFLSVADPACIEQRVFDFHGKLQHFRKIHCPVLTILAGADEYEPMPPEEILRVLESRYAGPSFTGRIIPRADHGFHDKEDAVLRTVRHWLRKP